MTRATRGGNPLPLFESERTMTPAPSATSVDAATFIQEHQRRGEHVAVGHLLGVWLVHPGCDLPCEYSGRPILDPPPNAPLYVAEIRADGVIAPHEHAAWEDVARAIDPVAFAERNAE